jgi:hypothetical protein
MRKSFWGKLMRRLIRYGIPISFAAAGLCFLAGLLLAEDWGREFWSNFFLNVTAELLGLALTVWIASIVAKHKLDELIPRVVDLIAHLRKDNKINGETARSAVTCAVEIFSEERFLRTRPALSILTHRENCQVCLLRAETEPQKDNTVRCQHCRLPSSVWKKD